MANIVVRTKKDLYVSHFEYLHKMNDTINEVPFEMNSNDTRRTRGNTINILSALFISPSAKALDTILDVAAPGLLAVIGIQPELNPCPGNSTLVISDSIKAPCFTFILA